VNIKAIVAGAVAVSAIGLGFAAVSPASSPSQFDAGALSVTTDVNGRTPAVTLPFSNPSSVNVETLFPTGGQANLPYQHAVEKLSANSFDVRFVTTTGKVYVGSVTYNYLATAGSVAPPTTTPATTPATTPVTTPATTTPTPTPTTTAPHTYSCNVNFPDGCPLTNGYVYPANPNSNGYTTFVQDQDVGANAGTGGTLHANNPGDWQVVANDVPYGETSVQTFPDVQQLMNNWSGPGAVWNGGGDTPLAALSSLKVNYAETSPTSVNSLYEFAPDIWQDNYGSDVMFWVDTKGRCNEGAFGSTVLGHAVLDGQNWTVHRYGGSGAEIIFVLDGAGGTGTCAQQHSGTVNIKAGLEWLVANGFETGPAVIAQVNTGWEITSADNQTFTVSQYSITAN